MHACIHIYISRCVYTCKCVCFCTHGCMFVCLPARVYLCMQESKNTWIMNHGVCCVCVYIYVYIHIIYVSPYVCGHWNSCNCTNTHITYMHIYTYTCTSPLINKWGRINRITNYLGRFCRSPARKTTSLQPGPDAQTIKWGRNDKKICRMASLF